MTALKQIARYTLTLYGLQLVMAGLVFLLIDWTWVAIPLGLAFLALVWIAGRSLRGDLDSLPRWSHGIVALVIGLLWQVPGLLATNRFVRENSGLSPYDGLSDLLDFLAETWHLALMPILSAIPAGTVDGYHARYYIALLACSPVLILLFTCATLLPRRLGR